MLNDRVSAGIKILGVYFFVLGFEKLIGLISALITVQYESKQFSTYLGAPSTSFAYAAATHQAISYLTSMLFFFASAFLCIKFTSMLTRLCGADAPNQSAGLP
ncbi:MAG TPA: hypothetical protein VFF76_05535 [Holophagaceae bacterium]|jgi:hypothetical protein|nr:hypothetical protein [Holophagaceae bacterium]